MRTDGGCCYCGAVSGVNMFAMLTGNLPFTVQPFTIKALYAKMIAGDMNSLPDYLSNSRPYIVTLRLLSTVFEIVVVFTARGATLCQRGICRRRVCFCVSVTLWHCIKAAKRRITQAKPHDSAGTLVFGCQRSRRNSNGITP